MNLLLSVHLSSDLLQIRKLQPRRLGWYRCISGLQSELGQKNGRKIDFGLTWEVGQKWRFFPLFPGPENLFGLFLTFSLARLK